MVPRWATQGEGSVCTGLDFGLRGQGNLRCAVGGLPGAGGDRGTPIKAVIAKLTQQAGRFDPAQRASRPSERQQVAIAIEFGPARPGALEEVQVVGAVNALQGRPAEIPRCLYRPEVSVLDALQDVVGARRHFEAGHQLPVHQLAAAVVQVVIVRVNRQHFSCSPKTQAWLIVDARGLGENVGNGQKGIDMAKLDVRNSPFSVAECSVQAR
ncbi:hypothetical protein D9M73_149540 [compost metagenome]